MKKLLALSSVLALGLALSACETTMHDGMKKDMAKKEMAKPAGKPVGITGSMMDVSFKDASGASHTISRNQDNSATVNEHYVKTSRPCPPFCIQPMTLAPGVDTIGEVEVLHYIKQMHSGEPVIVQDSRTPDWHERVHIPGTVNISFKTLSTSHGADPIGIAEIMTEQFGVVEEEGILKYSNAKTLVLYCNGMWCGQSPAAIKTLLKLGYPAHKIKWYRGGMQSWTNLGLTTSK
ncbi:MAG: rhodanese-like domain-containing protein [Arenicellales bacterium]